MANGHMELPTVTADSDVMEKRGSLKLKRLPAAIVCAFILAVSLAACGDDDDTGASTAPSAAAPKGAPIKLGSICSCTGAQESVLGGSDTVLKAWEAHVNASGGLNGHPVELTVIDDAGDPAKALQAAKQLVEQEKVVAIVGNTTLASAAIAPYLSQQGIPVIGGSSPNATFLTDPNWFPSNSNLLVLTYGTMDIAKQAGKAKLGVMYCAESPVCAQLVPLAEGIGRVVGIQVVPQKISGTAPNYTAACQSMKDEDVDALFVVHNGTVAQRVFAGCSQQNYDPTPISQSTTSTPDYLQDPNLEGGLNSAPAANPYDASLPVVKEMREALDSYESGFTDSDQFTYASVVFSWSGGLLFEAVAEVGKLGPDSTPDEVKSAIYKLKDETLEGLTGPLVFTKGKPAFTPCWFTQSIEGGELVSANDNKPSCLTDKQATQLRQSLPSG